MTAVALESAPTRVRAATLLPAAVFLLVVAVAWWAGEPYVVGVFHDDGAYALLARAIAGGRGFHMAALPGEPAVTHYPPLYPLLLAAAWRLAPAFPDNVTVLLGLNAILSGFAALGLARFAVQSLRWRVDAAAIFAVLAMLTTPTLTLTSALLSEPLFLALLLPALLLVDRAVRADDRRAVAWAGVGTGVLMLVRTHGVALLVALVVALVLHRRAAHAAIAAAAAALVLLPWQVWSALATPHVTAPLEGAYGSYLGWYLAGLRDGSVPFVLGTVRLNMRESWLLLVDRVALGPAGLRAAMALFAAGFIALGAWRTARRSLVSVLFVAAYLAIVLVWPFAPWRFVWAIWPVILLLGAEGARWAVEAAPTTRRRMDIAVAVAIPAVAMVVTEWNAFAERSWLQPGQRAAAQATPVVRWVGARTRSDDVVLTEAAPLVALFTGRRTAPPASFTAREYLVPPDTAQMRAQLHAMLGAVQPHYLVALLPGTQQAARSLAAMPHAELREIGALPEARALVFEVAR